MSNYILSIHWMWNNAFPYPYFTPKKHVISTNDVLHPRDTQRTHTFAALHKAGGSKSSSGSTKWCSTSSCSTLVLGVLNGCFRNSGTPKSSISIGFSIINHPFWGTPIFGNIQMHHSIYDDRFGALRCKRFVPHGTHCFSRWWNFKYFLFSPRTLEKWFNLTSIFFRWVGSTTKQMSLYRDH